MRTTELRSIVEEEASVIDPDDYDEERRLLPIRNSLYRVLGKLHKGDYNWTSADKAVVRYAMEDVGSLYRQVGTSAGFDVESPAMEREHQTRGNRALDQARTVGLI